ncbi:DUF1289 domain-containing protein [Sinimarinibacterium thermocellulolyticum]|uniref:DUF1289 domain-containing protein n=1 Tax=Sinimarinibacterium thermocellulolyticum TaxID=3170016 RepID=A0ABV2A9M4_9GAMM
MTQRFVSEPVPSEHFGDVPSPCIKVCTLDARGLCTGCLRHIDEITCWGAATPAQRRAILDRIAQRRAALAAALNREQGAET